MIKVDDIPGTQVGIGIGCGVGLGIRFRIPGLGVEGWGTERIGSMSVRYQIRTHGLGTMP